MKQNHNLDVMFLIETKVKHSVLESVKIKLSFAGKLVVDCVGRSGGLCLLWTNNIKVDLYSYTRFHIDVKMVSCGSVVWRLTGFYRDPDAS